MIAYNITNQQACEYSINLPFNPMISLPIKPVSSSLYHSNSTSKKSTSISKIFEEMIKNFENNKPKNLNVITVSEQFNISSRRVYDFFNVFTALGVCKNQYKGSIEWISIKKVTETIIMNYKKIEQESDFKTIKDLFNPGPSPSLGVIAMYFISLFFYLDIEILNIHKVSALFMAEKSDRKSLERRLYLVLAILELAGLVYHSQKTGEYCIKLPVHEIVKQTLENKKNNHTYGNTVLSLMSTVSDSFIRSTFSSRRKIFDQISSSIWDIA